MRNFTVLSKIAFSAIILFIANSFALTPTAQPPTMRNNQPMQSQRKIQTPQEKKQQLEQEAPNAMTAVDTAYKEILAFVNSAKSPSEADIKNFLKTVATNRKYLFARSVSDVQKSTYHIFSAWTYYYDNKQDKAAKEAVAGQKAAPNNINTLKTRFAISLINKDFTAVAEALAADQNTPAKAPRPTAPGEQQSYSQPLTDDIKFDVNAVRTQLLGKIFDLHPEITDVNSATWQTAGKLTCALFWKIDSNELDSFAPVVKKPKGPNEPNLAAIPQTFEQPPEWKKSVELAELSQLQNILGKDKRIFFAAVNLNSPEKRKNLVNWLAKNRQIFPIFQLAADQRQKADSIIGEDENPMLVIVAPDSTIRYVGDANGFLPQTIMQKILQNPQEFGSFESNEPNILSTAVSHPNQPPAAEVESAVEPNEISQVLTEDSNTADVNTRNPKTEPNKANAASASNNVPRTGDDILAAADDYQAQTLLSNAQSFFGIAKKTGAYRDPIEMCRRIIKNYPNTKYAQQAQMLLRNVPADRRQEYHITDQELGL